MTDFFPASAQSIIRLAARYPIDHAMSLTDICFPTLSTTSTRASWAPDSSQGSRRALVRGIRRFHDAKNRFGWPKDSTYRGIVLPNRCLKTAPLTPLSRSSFFPSRRTR
jgi:hypothetical protein